MGWLADQSSNTGNRRSWHLCRRRCHRSEEHTSELQSHHDLVCRLLLEKKKQYRKACRSTESYNPIKYKSKPGFDMGDIVGQLNPPRIWAVSAKNTTMGVRSSRRGL